MKKEVFGVEIVAYKGMSSRVVYSSISSINSEFDKEGTRYTDLISDK